MPEPMPKHRPAIDRDSEPFWTSVAERAMRLPRCRGCGRFRFPPSAHCPHCLSDATEWVRASGRGRVYAAVTFRRAFHPAWQDLLPYNASLIDLAEGVRMFSNVVDVPPEDVRVGMEVDLDYRERSDGFLIPVFRPGGEG